MLYFIFTQITVEVQQMMFVQDMFFSSYEGLSFLAAYILWSGAEEGNEAPQRDHMQFSYSDKDEFPDIGIQDSKYLSLGNEPAKVQLHCMASEKMHLTIFNGEPQCYHH